MKRIPLIFFLVLAFFTSRQVGAQQINEGFEGPTFPPPGWDTINITGVARWVSSNDADGIHTGSKAAFGQIETVPPGDGENWLITPKIYSVKNGDNLDFWAKSKFTDPDGGGYFDAVDVLVSTSGKATANFTTLLQKIVVYTQGSYTHYTFSLSAFANQNIYIAFRHYQNQGDGIFIDDVNVSTKLQSDVANISLSVSQPGIVKTNSAVDITATLKNVGNNTIAAGFPVRYSVNGVLEYSTTSASIGSGATTLVSFSGTSAFKRSIPGTYIVKVYADSIPEIQKANDTLTYIFTVQTPITSFPYFQPFNNPVGWSFDGTGNWDYSKSEVIAQANTDVINPAGNKDSAAVARFYNANSGTIFYLRSPLMNFTGISKPMLNFYVAHRSANSMPPLQNDQLDVVISLDGGTTYQAPLYTKSYLTAPSLSTLSPSSATRFTPTSLNDWRHEIVDLSAYAGQSNVLIAFKGTSDAGNNLWIDNVNILSQTASDYVSTKVITASQVVSKTFFTVKFNTVPNFDSVRIQGHSFTPPANNFAPNTTATSGDGMTIETPNFVFPRWATIAFSGNAITRATYNDSIDITGLIGISNPDKLYILKRSDQSGDWVALPTTRLGNVLAASGLNKFSDFAIGFYSVILPVNIVNFNARLVNKVSMLQWKVEQVKNVTSFDVERKTGNNWENIGNVAVSSPLQNDYNFGDATAHNGINYYRLKVNDGNGSFIYSNIVSVTLRSSLLVFQNAPNPFKDYTIVRYEIDEKAPVKIQVFNLSGSRVAVLTDEVKDQGSYEIRFNTSQLTPGNYYLKFTAGDKTEVKKMIRLQ